MFICLQGQTTPAHTLSKLITMWKLPLEMLGEALWNIVQGPHERRVKRYLNEATQGEPRHYLDI
jgi:hypothetical protein